ncbi:MAG: type IV conjugative transfer system protein TraL [Gammaproteobacteria bacterium]|nr:type IV conjugative transfer system protein TraL [Gammaproteobacteria bacterium]
MKDDFYIPQYLDEPERFLFFTIDEAIVLIGPIFVCWMLNFILTGLVLGPAFLILLRKFKGSEQSNIARYAAYWYLPEEISKMEATPPSCIREFVG